MYSCIRLWNDLNRKMSLWATKKQKHSWSHFSLANWEIRGTKKYKNKVESDVSRQPPAGPGLSPTQRCRCLTCKNQCQSYMSWSRQHIILLGVAQIHLSLKRKLMNIITAVDNGWALYNFLLSRSHFSSD